MTFSIPFWVVVCAFVICVNGDCNNPMFIPQVRMFGRERIPMNTLPSAQIQTNFGSCQHLDGQLSCCNSASFQPFEQYFRTYDVEMNIGIEVFKSQTPEEIELLVEHYGRFTLNQIQRVYMIQLITLVQPTIDAMNMCNGGLLGYKQGMLCFACHPDWSNYFDVVNNLMYLTKDTCDSMNHVCESMFTQLNRIAIPVLDNAIGIYNNSNAADAQMMVFLLTLFQEKVRETGSICTAFGYQDCQDMLCHGFLHGIAATLNLQGGGGGPPGGNKLQSYSEGTQSKEDESVLTALLEKNLFGEGLKASVEKYRAQHEKTRPRVGRRPSRKLLQQAPPGGVNHTYNCYGNGTYNYAAYTYGCECQLSALACPFVPSSSKAPNQALVIGASVASVVGLVILLIGVAYCLKKRTAPETTHVPLEENEEYEAPSNQRQLIEEGLKGVTPADSAAAGSSAYIAPNLVTTDGSING